MSLVETDLLSALTHEVRHLQYAVDKFPGGGDQP